MKKFCKVSMIIAISSFCTIISSSAFAEYYFYGVVTVGLAKYDIDTTGWTSDDDKDEAYSVGIGFKANKYIAFEAGYLDLGEISAEDSGTLTGTLYGQPYSATGTLKAKAETDGIYFGPQISYPFTEKFSVFAKGGVYFWDLDAKATATGSLTYAGTTYVGSATAKASDDGEDLYYGIGASHDITDIFSVKADWTRYEVAEDDVDVFVVGLLFKF